MQQLTSFAGFAQPIAGINELFRRFPQGFQQALGDYNPLQRMVALMVIYYFAPMYLILPLMVSSVVAADNPAGEKERKTMEALLYTPTTDRELLVANCFGLVACARRGLDRLYYYSVVVGISAWPTFGFIFFPTGMWWLLALWVAPAIAGWGLAYCPYLAGCRHLSRSL